VDKDRSQIEHRIATEKLPGDINSLTIVLLGHPATGKTSLVSSALGKQFSKIHSASTAYEMAQKKLPNREGFTINLVDVGGAPFLPKNQTTLKTQQEKRWREADVFAIVYACDDKESFETAKHIKKNILVDDLARTSIVLVCTKIERSEKSKVVSVEDGKKLAEDWGCQIYFTSAKSNENTSVFDAIALFYLEDLLATSTPRGLDDSATKARKKSFGSRLASAVSIKSKDKEPKSSGNVGSPDAVSPRNETPRNETPRSTSFKLSSLSLSGKSHKPELKNSEIPFARVETTYDKKSSSSEDYVPPDSMSYNQTTESDEFLSEHSEESKRKIRAARRRFEKQGCGDGGWDQTKIQVTPRSPK